MKKVTKFWSFQGEPSVEMVNFYFIAFHLQNAKSGEVEITASTKRRVQVYFGYDEDQSPPRFAGRAAHHGATLDGKLPAKNDDPNYYDDAEHDIVIKARYAAFTLYKLGVQLPKYFRDRDAEKKAVMTKIYTG